MTATRTSRRRLAHGAAAAVAAVAAAWPLATVASAEPDEPVVPTKVQVPEGNKLFLVGHATGVQIYPCNATAGGYVWGASTPRADLYNDAGKLIVTHFGGPTWRARDGSSVVGTRVDGATVDPTAIQWLLLAAASTSVGADGDHLAGTTYIQRIATVGGLPPAPELCNALTAGTRQEVGYTADYYFWKKQES